MINSLYVVACILYCDILYVIGSDRESCKESMLRKNNRRGNVNEKEQIQESEKQIQESEK